MHLFPTHQWLGEYSRHLSESDLLSGLVTATGSPGDVLFVVRDLPVETTTVGDLPEVALADLPPTVREGLADLTLAEAPSVIDPSVRHTLPEIPADLLDQLETLVHDGDIYARITIDGDGVTEVDVLESPEVGPDDTVITGSCATWQQIIAGRPALAALATGDLVIEESPVTVAQYGGIFQLLGDVAADVETTHIFAEPDTPLPDAVLDEALRQPLAIQRTVQRTVATTLQTFSPF